MNWIRSSVLAVLCLLWGMNQSVSAVNLLYDFEGDSGTTVTDKLTTDGAQNGVIYNSVDPADDFNPHFGMQSAFFDNPPLVSTLVPPWSTIEIPDTQFGADFSLTVAAWVNHDIDVQRRVRVFSSFQGTGPVSDSLLLDFSNTGATANVRGIVDGTSLTSAPVAAAATAGYHHLAMTVGSGTMTLFFDGTQVMSGALPAGYVNSNANIFVGEDPHNLGGAANEQLIGNVDEVLLLGRALSAGEIAQLAAGNQVSSVVTPAVGERAVYYDLEGDTGQMATDKFTLDSGQNGIIREIANADSDPANAKIGDSSFSFQDPRINDPTSPEEIYSQINAGPIGELGSKFTISAAINPYSTGQTGNGIARVLSSYRGSGSTAGQLILDVNPIAVTGNGVRLYLPSNTGSPSIAALGSEADIDLDPGTIQTLTAVYDNGSLALYLDGIEIKSTTLTSTSETLGGLDLRIGEDRGNYALASANENFVGSMDDVLMIGRALTAEQVAYLHANGAVALLSTIEITGDYNGDGIVDAADYTVWRDTVGQTGDNLAADGNNDQMIDGMDYDVWKSNFGSSGAASGGANIQQAVPEPSALVVAMLACLTIGLSNRK